MSNYYINHAETWILYHGSTDTVSKVVKEAYQDYKAMEFYTETKAMSDQEPRIKLISLTALKVQSLFVYG